MTKPALPYYAVIFKSQRNKNDSEGYEKMAERMLDLATQQKGFLGIESVRDAEGSGITVSYWKKAEDIKTWKGNSEHQVAQEFGRSDWYSAYDIKICRVEREFSFDASQK